MFSSHVSASSGSVRWSMCFRQVRMSVCPILWMFIACRAPGADFFFEQGQQCTPMPETLDALSCVRVLASIAVCGGGQGCMPACAPCVCFVYERRARWDCVSVSVCVCVCECV